MASVYRELLSFILILSQAIANSTYKETGRVVLDRKTFQEENCLKEVALFPLVMDDDLEPGDTAECMLCPPYVYGYSLARKEWCKFYIDNLSNVQWKEKAFDSLVMGDSQKLVLRALVSSHMYPNNARDRPQQKGKGLVILLHGSPGSGKTLTAGISCHLRLFMDSSLTAYRVCR
jgi:hypothetical protein